MLFKSLSRHNGRWWLFVVAVFNLQVSFAADPDIIVTIEEPTITDVSTGIANLRGWAIGLATINKIELFIDGQYNTDIPSGAARADVGAAFPSYPNANKSGFSLAFPYTLLSSGSHIALVRAFDVNGLSQESSTTFEVARLDSEFISDPNQVSLAAASASLAGQEVIISNLSAEGLSYDVRLRWRVASQQFEMSSVIQRSASALSAPETVISSSGGVTTAVSPASAPIVITLEEPSASFASNGIANLRGWAVGLATIEKIELFIDGQYSTDVPSGGTRNDVGNAFPDYPNSNASGFSMAFPYSELSKGSHTALVRAHDVNGLTQESSAVFNVVKLDTAFINNLANVNLDNASVSIQNEQIIISNFIADNTSYDVYLQWQTATQQFEMQNVVKDSSAGMPACSDGIDNDADNLIDFPDDPGCSSLSDEDEFNSNGVPNNNITSVQGSITGNIELVINGVGFTEKINAKPLFWWKADFGTAPSPLGRMATWSDDDNLGTFSTSIVAPGSQKSAGTDYGSSSGIALSRINFDSDRLYLYRKTYEDFDITTDEAINARINLTSGSLQVGDIITGQTSGATAQIVSFKEAHPNITYMTHILKYNNVSGSINDQPQIDFVDGEQMKSSSNAIMSSVSFFRTFNFKTIRMSVRRIGNVYPRNNMHMNAQGAENSKFRITPEYTEGTTWSGQFTNQILHQLPREWKVEELQYETSGVNVKDGTFNFYQKGILGTDNKFRMRNTDEPNRYNSIVQSQVSHNAQPGSVMYYDSLYVDDTWHRVLICPEATWSTRSNCEVQIPTSWNNNQVTVHINKGGLDISEPSYLYVIDKNGSPNENGWLLTP